MADGLISRPSYIVPPFAVTWGAEGTLAKYVDLANPLPVQVAGIDTVIMPESLADGADVTQGAKVDAAWDGAAASPSIVSILKALWGRFPGLGAKAATNSLSVTPSSDGFPVTVPGAATEATLEDIDLDIEAMSAKLPATIGAKTGANSLSVVPASDGFMVTLQASTTEPDGTKVVQIDTVKSKFTDNFSGAAYAAGAASLTALGTNWTVVRQTLTTMTVTLNNGSLAVNMGTTNGDELPLIGKNIATIPANLIATFLMSQRIANNEVRFGYCEVDATGALVANANLANFPNNMGAVMFNGTTATTATVESICSGLAAQKTQAVGSGVTTGSAADYSIECRPEDVTLVSQQSDSANGKSNASGRLSSVVPDPGKRYAPFIWIRNVGVPGSGTTVTINRIYSSDIQELQAEIIGRGNAGASQAVPVNLAAQSQNPITVNQNGATFLNGGSNGNLFHKLIAAATTNGTSVKGSAGRLHAGGIKNLTATPATVYLHWYNKASAPTVGTDVPIMVFAIKSGEYLSVADMINSFFGGYFSAGIAYAVTLGAADGDSTAIAVAGDFIINLQYI